MKQALEEVAKEAIHKHYGCNGTYPCSERDYCEHCNGHNTAFDCCECGADEFKEGFIAGAEWQLNKSPWIIVKKQSWHDLTLNPNDLPEHRELVVTKLKSDMYHYAVGLYNQTNGIWYLRDGEDFYQTNKEIVKWQKINE